MQLSSSAFKDHKPIPAKYTCKGEDCSPPLHIIGVSEKAKSLALIVDDPDAPAKIWVHWLISDLPIVSDLNESAQMGVFGLNDSGGIGYGGPCPPSGTHRYFFKLYALDCTLNLKSGYSREALEKAMHGHVIDKCELIGLFSKS